eukprot:s581_g32.t1
MLCGLNEISDRRVIKYRMCAESQKQMICRIVPGIRDEVVLSEVVCWAWAHGSNACMSCTADLRLREIRACCTS